MYRERIIIEGLFIEQVNLQNQKNPLDYQKPKEYQQLMTSNLSAHSPLNAPPTLRELTEKHNITLGNEQPDKGAPLNSDFSAGLSQNYAIQFELKNISRQVQKITEKGKYLGQRPQLNSSMPLFRSAQNFNQPKIDLSRILNLKTNALQVGKYNYYGQQYRFQTQKPLNNDEKPLQFNESNQNEELKSSSSTTKYLPKRQELNEKDTQSYYIYFDQSKNQRDVMEKSTKVDTRNLNIDNFSYPSQKRSLEQPQPNAQKKHANQQRFAQYGEENDEARTPPVHVFSKQQPQSKWVLEKKVKRLQKELNEIKKKEQRRERLKNFTYNQPKKDEKVFVGRQVDQLINSLWP